MALKQRLYRLENSLPIPVQPKPDLANLSIEELRFMVRYLNNEEASDDILRQINTISKKVFWGS